MFEVTLFEDEDILSLGAFPTREQALIALGKYVLANKDLHSLAPRIWPQVQEEEGVVDCATCGWSVRARTLDGADFAAAGHVRAFRGHDVAVKAAPAVH